MKKIIVTILFFSLTWFGLSSVKAQSFSFGDLFGQQGKKERLMAQQVSGLYLYLSAVKDGYRVMHQSLGLAQEFKGGTFGLHTAYYQSLLQVNPVVRQDPKGKAIAELAAAITETFKTEIDWQKKQQQLKPAELAYLQKVADNLRSLADKDLAETTDLLTPGKLQLTDHQRLNRLDKVCADMKDMSAFAASFTAKCRALAQSRLQAKAEREQLKKLYGIH